MKVLSILTIGALAFTIQQSADLLNASNKINSNETNERSNQISLHSTEKKTSKEGSKFKVKKELNYKDKVDNLFIFGNYDSFDSIDLQQHSKNKNNIYVYYDLYLDDNDYKEHQIMQKNATIYYYKNGIKTIDSYNSNSIDIKVLSNDINKFVNEKLMMISKENSFKNSLNLKTNHLNSLENQTTWISTFSGSNRDEMKSYGYVDVDFVVRKYRANDVSSLYILESNFSFIPGKIARTLGSLEYGEWYNSSGYVKVEPVRAWHDVGYNQIRQGGTPVYKDAFPVNSPGQVTINSTYSNGVTLGHSFKNGFSLDGLTIENETSVGVNISESYSKSYTNVEPALSTQKDPINPKKYTWLYTYLDPRNETNHLNTRYMFEMNNKGHDMYEGDIAFTYDYQFSVADNVIGNFEVKKIDGRDVHDCY